MIFVTVGSNEHQFNRLLEEIDKLAGSSKLNDKIIAQIGNSTYIPKNIEYFKFKPYNEIEKIVEESRIIISHAGAGSIMLALEKNKPLIVVPRMKKYGEHINDHQIEITRELEKQKKLIGVYDISKLESAIYMSRKIKKINRDLKKTKIIDILNEYIKKWGLLND
ncbi:MAG: PssE/Cps14G family polysaccharide biosynthesis glycosyltransferase [Candidatus Aenigmatarchaeota archaeon]